MKDRLDSPDYRFILICLTLLAASVWFCAGNFYRAFPEASIDFRVTRTDAESRAQQFLAGQGYAFANYRVASSFTYDDEAKTFLEREAGLEKANQLMGTRVRLWRWAFRWFRPQQKEEFRADITPGGDFVAFEHELAEDTPRPEITADQARSLAEDFLRTRAHRDPASLDFVEASTTARPHRTDREFTWKEHDFDIHDGTYRIVVTMLGNEVGGYGEYLKVPDQWSRDYDRLRSKNHVAGTVDAAVTFALLIGLIVVVVMRVRRQDIRWHRAAMVGVIGIGLSFLSSLNEFPLAEYGYRTTDTYGSFVAQNVLQAMLSALGVGGLLFVITAGAEVLYREAFADKISLGSLFSRRGLRTKRFFLGAILGVTLCAIFLAYQIVFYLVANKLGAWSPADVPYSDLLNTKFPWLYVLLGGYLPAISEEFGFRMFAIPFLRKLFRWLPAAIVLAGFIWGFGHAEYPNQPFFIRGLEVGIGGVALGLIMLRWGILPTLIWHYSVDAMYSALLLLRSHSLYFRLSGAASAGIFIVPILVALVAYWRHGGFEPVTGLLNGDEPAAPERPLEAPRETVHILDYWPLSPRMRLLAIALLVLGLAPALITAARFGDTPNFKLTADQARADADAFLRTQQLDPSGYLHVTYPETHTGGSDSLTAKYFLEHRTLSAASKLFEQYRPVRYWDTRYFKPLEKEEITVAVQPETGRILGFNRTMPEDRAGADLAPDAARRLAAGAAMAQGFDVAAMDLKESESQKQKARRDYTLVWEAPPGDARNVEEAHYRVDVSLAGDVVSGVRAYWKLPETFERGRERQTFVSLAVTTIRMATTAAAIVFGLWILILQIRLGQVPWRRTLLIAALPTVMTILVEVLSFHANLYRSYDTSMPMETAMATNGLGVAMSVAFAYFMYAAAIGLVLTFFPQSETAWKPPRGIFARDAVVLLLLAFVMWHFCHQLAVVLADRFHALAFVGVDDPSPIGLPAPWLIAVCNVAREIFTRAATLALAVLAVRSLPKRWLLAPAALLVACALISDAVRTPGELLLEYAVVLVIVGCLLMYCFWFGRRNYLAYALVIGVGAAYAPLAQLVHSGNDALKMQAWIVVALTLIALTWALLPGLVKGPGAKA